MESKKKCSQCQRTLDVGVDVIRVEEGVMGLKGFVSLDNVLFFCCEECVREYYDLSGLPSLPGRLPR